MMCTVTSWRDTVTSPWQCSKSQELFVRIWWFFVLNPMFSGSKISNKMKPSSWRVPWRHDGTPWRHHDIVQHLRNYLSEFDGFCAESYVESNHHKVYRDAMMVVELCHDDVTVSRHVVTVHVTMTASFFRNPWPRKHRIHRRVCENFDGLQSYNNSYVHPNSVGKTKIQGGCNNPPWLQTLVEIAWLSPGYCSMW